MATSALQIDYAAAIEACQRADWLLAQAFTLLVKPWNAALYVEGADPEQAMAALLEAIRSNAALVEAFTRAKALGE